MERLSRVGFIGLGNMGRPMAVCLLKAGFTLTVLDVTREVQQAFVDFHGAHSASSLSELGSRSDAVITMLPNGHKVSRVVLGVEGDDRKDYRPKRYVSFHWYPPSSLKRSQSQTTGNALAVSAQHGFEFLLWTLCNITQNHFIITQTRREQIRIDIVFDYYFRYCRETPQF